MAGQFPGMAGGGISQNNSFMMQQQGAPPQPGAGGVSGSGGGVFTSQAAAPLAGESGSFGGQPGSFSGYPSSQAGLSQPAPGGYPNPPAYTQSGGAAYSLSSSFMSSSYGAQSPVYSQSGPAARPQMSASPAGFPGPGPGPAGPYQHHFQQPGFQTQPQPQQPAQQPQQPPAGFAAPMQGFPSPQPQPQFSQSVQQQQLQAQFAMQQQQQQQQQQAGQQQPFSALQQQQANLPTQTMMTSASGGSVAMSQQQAGVPTPTPPQAQVPTMATQQQAQQPAQPQQQPQQPQQQPQQQQQRDYNVATICRYGQEHLLDLVNRSQELFNLLKLHQPPNGTVQGANISAERQNKIKQHLDYIRMLFRRLRMYHDRISECCAGLEFTPIEGLIPYKDEPDSRLEDKKQSEQCRQALEEFNEMKEHVQLRSRYLKEVIDQLRNIVWDVNTMLAMRHPT